MRRDDLSSRNPAESAQLRVALIGRPRLVARDHGDIALPEKAYLLLAMLKKDEILDLLAYVLSGGDKANAMFR